MTKKQLQSTIEKEFKKRLRREYGRWTDLWTLSVKKFDKFNAGDLMKLTFHSDFTEITIIYDCCLNISVLVTGCAELSACLRVFMDVADECERYVHWILSKDKVHEITFVR